MKTSLLLFFNCFVYIKLVEAQLRPLGPDTVLTPATIPGLKSSLSTPASNIPPPFERMAPKCYPETAKAYFLPAPPTAPIITILDTKSKDIVANFVSTFKEISSNIPVAPKPATNQASFLSPPGPVLPDLIDEVPFIVQDRFSRLAESDNKVCDTCALVAKLPIYNFDQELLDGFLAGLGL